MARASWAWSSASPAWPCSRPTRPAFGQPRPGGPTGWTETWGPTLAIAACLLATLCYGISASYTRRYLGGLPSLVTATGSQIGATLGLALPAILFWPARTPGLTAWLAILFVGVACTGIAYVLYFRLIESAGPARALTVTFLVPVFALFYGGVFLGESITPWMIGCGAVTLVGTSLSTGMLKLWRSEAETVCECLRHDPESALDDAHRTGARRRCVAVPGIVNDGQIA